MKKQIKNMKFRVGFEQDSIAIQKLLFMMGIEWCKFDKYIKKTNRPYLYAYCSDNTINCGWSYKLYEIHQNKETTIEELKSIVGEWLYGDILGCQVSIPSGTAFVKGVEVLTSGLVILTMQKDRDVLRECVNNCIGFFTNDYNDDTLPFEDFLKFIRSDNVIKERKYK